MKWMCSAAVVLTVAASAAMSAQSGKDMRTPAMGGEMKTTFTGCLEAVNHGGSFVLTHIGEAPGAATHHDAMPMDAMAAEHEPGADAMHADRMMSRSVLVTGRSDFGKHAGRKVTVTGSLSHATGDAMSNTLDTLAVDSLKVVAKSCS